jgi:hypothetical protein
MTTDPGAVPPDANPLTDLEGEELECLIKGEESPRMMTTATNRKMVASSSLLMQEETQQQPSSSLPSVGAVVIGAAAVVVGGVAGAVATVASSAAPQKPNNTSSPPPPPPLGAAPQSSSPHHVHGPNCNHNNNNNNNSTLPPRGRRMCRRCQAYKPPRAHHCSICKRCIIKMDHHCPWVNNCVGIGNHKYFLLFIFYTSLSCGYSLSLLVWRFYHCVGGGTGGIGRDGHYHRPRCVDHPTDLLPLIGLTVEALLFGLFTLCMMCDQWDVVMTNLTHIDRLKGHDTLQHRVQAGINEVFGTGRSMTSSSSTSSLPQRHHATNYRRGFHYTWLSPLHKACFPDTVRDDIFGYCRPVSGGGRRQNVGIEMSGLSGGGAEIV